MFQHQQPPQSQHQPPASLPGPPPIGDPQELNTAMWCHLSALLTSLLTCGFLGFLPPLLFLNHNNRRSAFVDFHAKQSLNHQLTCLCIYAIGTVIIFFGSALCCLGLFLFIPLIALLILSCVLEGLATMQAQNGQWIRLPVSFPFVS